METVEVKVSDAFTSGVASAPTVLCSADSKLIKLRDELTGESDGGKWTTNATTGWDATLATFNTQLAKVGIYTFEYKFDANGACAGDDETVKVTINETPTAEAGKDDAFNCDKTSITLGGNTTSGGGDIELSWTPNNGGLSSTNTAKPSVNKPGTYILTVKNTKTGCTAMDTITIKSNTNVPTGGNIKLVNPKCFGEANGTITVENIVGGTPPYLYAINGGTFAANSTISGLKAGTFKVSILDATGCEWSTTATLTDPKTTVTLELGDDKYISLGDSVKLKPTTSINDGTLLWTNATTLSCDKCISPVASPLTSTIYSAQLTDKNGCTATDRIGVFVEIKKPYIPNAFSPNGDGNNDVFTIFIDPKLILKVNFLRVYDRWGNLVFDQQDFKPNDITTGWNGAYRGKDMNSDVFAYVCEIEYKNGQKILYKGDVTLTR
jgi:gliding motility-associated-like protein